MEQVDGDGKERCPVCRCDADQGGVQEVPVGGVPVWGHGQDPVKGAAFGEYPLEVANLLELGYASYRSGTGFKGVLFETNGADYLVNFATMTQLRVGAAAGVVGGRLYICGGALNYNTVLATVERFDPITGKWEAIPSMLAARHGASAGTVNGMLHVCGGWGPDEKPLASTERFCPRTGQWTWGLPLLHPRFSSGAAAISGCLYVCGGQHSNDPLSSVECYDAKAGGIWVAAPSMLEKRSAPAVTATPAAFSGTARSARLPAVDVKATEAA